MLQIMHFCHRGKRGGGRRGEEREVEGAGGRAIGALHRASPRTLRDRLSTIYIGNMVLYQLHHLPLTIIFKNMADRESNPCMDSTVHLYCQIFSDSIRILLSDI